MTEPQSNRINVSEDKLDAKLARLELNLVDRITKSLDVKADQIYVHQLEARLGSVEASIQATVQLVPSFKDTATDVETRLRGLERFRYAIPSAAILSAAAAIAVAVSHFHVP